MLEEEVDLLFEVRQGCADFAGELFEAGGVGGGLLVGGEAGDGFDAADAGSGGGFAEDFEEANLPGTAKA